MGSERPRRRALIIAAIAWGAPALALAQVAPDEPPPPPPPPPDPGPADEPPAPAPDATPAPAPPDPAPAPTPAPTPPPITPSRRADPKPQQRGDWTLAFELGYGWTADTDQVYGNGFGLGLMFAVKGFELRLLESYDLADRSGMLDAQGHYGHMSVTSVAYRMSASLGPLALRPLLGLAWMRRSSFVREEFLGPEPSSQHGLALLAGGGVEIALGRLVVGADLRIYPTKWVRGLLDIGEPRERAVVREDALVYEPYDDKPGGFPRTLTGWLGVTW